MARSRGAPVRGIPDRAYEEAILEGLGAVVPPKAAKILAIVFNFFGPQILTVRRSWSI